MGAIGGGDVRTRTGSLGVERRHKPLEVFRTERLRREMVKLWKAIGATNSPSNRRIPGRRYTVNNHAPVSPSLWPDPASACRS